MWSVRCVHEAQLWPRNCFITLTYNDSHLPRPGSLDPRALQLFFKRLRKHMGSFRYYACGEYGDENWRPHYHALLFGLDFDDKVLFRERGGVRVYVSPTLTRIWGMGHCTVGELTQESAAYCARYTMKKVYGDQAPFYYSELDPYTGELVPLVAEFSRMSLKPGIGALWLARYQADVFPDDFVVVKGKRMRVPDYYDTLFERSSGEEALSEVKDRRKARALARAADNTPERLHARERVLKAKIKKLKREV